MTPAVFAHGRLRLYLLGLLAERPMHGYELIQALGARFGGTYTPSAGTIYPRLAKLEDEGLVAKSSEGRKTVYAITDAGRAELAGRESELDEIETDVSDSVRRLATEVRSSVEDAMRTLRAELAAAAREAREDSQVGSRVHPDGTAQRAESTRRLGEAELLVQRFRGSLRAELRRGEVTAETLGLLETGLEALHREVVASLRR
ncbi:MAG: PadR family transcriptional regulator [Microbacteriaceae bacterium]